MPIGNVSINDTKYGHCRDCDDDQDHYWVEAYKRYQDNPCPAFDDGGYLNLLRLHIVGGESANSQASL